MSDDEKIEPEQAVVAEPSRQPAFNLPAPLTLLCAALIAVEALNAFVLNIQARQDVFNFGAFFPYRLIDPGAVDGGWIPLIWTPFTHAFLHSGWDHLLMNVLWLVIFGTPVARRYGARGLYAIFLIGAAMGALAFAATTLPEPQVLVGASGGIAALTGAAIRFIFQPPVVVVDPDTGEPRMVGRRLGSIADTFRSRNALFFSIVWIVLNGIVPLLPALIGMDVQIAWQAHIGGFLTGFLIVPLFERRA